ncbi:hypothetical protein ACFLQZ_00705 [Acidobacteriota bacterium]
MQFKNRFIAYLCILVLGSFLFQSCAVLQELGDALVNLKRLQFKLGSVGQFSIAGINLGQIASLTDLTAVDGLKLLSAFQNRNLPAEMTLDIRVINPNDGSGGMPKTVSTLTSLESRLLIDGDPTVTGNIDQPIEIPGTGQVSTIPLRMSINLFEFFGDKGYQSLIELALSIGGLNKNSSRLSLDAQPRVSTPYGDILYPGRILIIDKEFR